MKENWKSDDWMACWIGFIIILIGAVAVLTGWFDFSALKFGTWTLGEKAATASSLWSQFTWKFLGKLLLTFAVLMILFGGAVKIQGGNLKKYIPAFLMLFFLAVIVRLVSAEFTLYPPTKS